MFVSGESSLPGLEAATVLLCAAVLSVHPEVGGGERDLLSRVSYKDTNPIGSGTYLRASFNLNYFLAVLSPNTVTLRVKPCT